MRWIQGIALVGLFFVAMITRSQTARPVLDSDRDGVVDSLDRCPTLSGFSSNCGCPPRFDCFGQVLPDRDKDGMPDRVDNCPDKKGHEANCGCPPLYDCNGKFLDEDHDGVPTPQDRCPTKKGRADNHGCP